MKEALASSVHARYLKKAYLAMPDYLKQCELIDVPQSDIKNWIVKVYRFSHSLLVTDGDTVTKDSVRKVVTKFPKPFHINTLHIKLFQLLLFIIEQELGFKSPPLPQFVEVNPEQPIITLAPMLDSGLHGKLYAALDDERVIIGYLRSPQENSAIIVLWLFLKEGFCYARQICEALNSGEALFCIDRHWFYQDGDRRYWLSPMGELMLSAWRKCSAHLNGTLPNIIDRWAKDNHIITPYQKLRIATLKQGYQLETLFQASPIEMGVISSLHANTLLDQNTLYRMITGHRVEVAQEESQIESVTTRQQTAWFNSTGLNKTTISTKKSQAMSLTVSQQLADVNYFIADLKKLPAKASQHRAAEIKPKLRVWLENATHTARKPWVWLVLAWLYKLLSEGGKHKKTLRLDTIRSYVSYVAKPFITEFSGCNTTLLNSEAWAEKFNIIAEGINAPSKKGYVLYFAELLVESGLVPRLCLSDLDIPVVKGQVSAHILTHDEADRVIEELNRLTGSKRRQAVIIFSLGFYAGLRRGEIAGLQYKDFHYNETLTYFTLHVRANRYRSLKSPDSARNLPLDALLPIEVLDKLREFINSSRAERTRTMKLFSNESETQAVFDLVTRTIQGVTGDDRLRFHHCRNSFCNWMWFKMNQKRVAHFKHFSFLNHHYFDNPSTEVLYQRLGVSPFSRKKMWALSMMLGHASPDTTLSSYFHLGDFLRRAKVSNHTPSMRILRAFWGQKARVNDFGQIHIKPSIAECYQNVVPQSFTPPLRSDRFQLINHTQQTMIKNSDSLSLNSIWRVIRRAALGQTAEWISEDLNIPVARVIDLIERDNIYTQTSLPKSKHKFLPHVNYQKLNHSDVKYLQTLIRRFDYAQSSGRLQGINLNQLQELKSSFVVGKDFLLRTTKQKPVEILLKLLKIMGIKDELISIQWYFPSLSCSQSKRLDKYYAHYQSWVNLIFQQAGIIHCEIKVLIPKSANATIVNKFKGEHVVKSDDGCFLPYRESGFVSVHVRKVSYGAENSVMPKVAKLKRGKGFVSFVRLVMMRL